jgi:hypothetical protein
MNLMSRLSADGRARKRLREARAEIRRAERSIRKRNRPANPGYDELRCPYFIGVMVLALVVLFFDLRADSSALVGWAQVLPSLSPSVEMPHV